MYDANETERRLVMAKDATTVPTVGVPAQRTEPDLGALSRSAPESSERRSCLEGSSSRSPHFPLAFMRARASGSRQATRMVDRVYKEDLPQSRNKLEGLKEEFVKLGPSGTRWARLRIDPLLKHVDTLEHLIHSDEFSGESSRLTRGVELFHSDLVYIRQNIKGLQKLLISEKRRLKK